MRTHLSILCAAACWAASCGVSPGQLVLHARLPHSRMMQYEPIRVEVRIDNNTSQELRLDGSGLAGRLLFDVEQIPGQLLSPQPEAGGPALVVPARKAVTAEINLCDLYDMRDTGPYTVRPKLEWGDKSFPGPKLYVDVVPGFEIERFVEDVGRDTSFRTFSLLTLNRERGEYLFLKVEDEDEGLCFGMVDLGRIVRLHTPVLSVDVDQQVHVLHQSGPTQFAHTILTVDGDIVERKTYRTSIGTPAMERDSRGKVTIRGGEPAVAEPAAEEPAGGVDMGVVPRAEDDLFSPVRSLRQTD